MPELQWKMQCSPVVTWTLLMQSTSLGSGPHPPFPIHVAELDPLSISPEGQVNVTLFPSNAGSS